MIKQGRETPSDLESVTDLLHQLREAGEVESVGDFTLDLNKLHEKLGSYQMEAAHHFILPFVAAGTLSGAGIVDFKGEFRRLTIEFDGRPYSLDELQACINESDGRCGELGTGLKFAVSSGASRVQIASGQGEFLNILETTKNQTKFYQLPNTDHRLLNRTRVYIKGCDIPPTAPTPYSFLCERCGFSPIVAWRGKRVHSPRPEETCGLLRFTSREGEDPSVSVTSWVTAKSENPEFTGQVWMEDKDRSEIRFLLHGVVYPTAVPMRRYQGLQGVVAYPEARLDLSRASVVVDKDVDRILEEIESKFEELVYPRVVRNFRGMLPFHRGIAKRFLGLWLPHCGVTLAPRVERLLEL